MNYLQQLTSRYLNLVFQHTSILPITIGIMGLLYSIGFLIGDTTISANYYALEAFLPSTGWGILFSLYALIKLMAPVYRVNTVLKILCSFWGLWAWNYTIFSFIILDASPIAPAELMLIAPLLLEVADLSVQLWEHKFCRRQRQGITW